MIKLRVGCSKADIVKHRFKVAFTITNDCLGRSSCSCFVFAFTALRNRQVNNRVLSMSLVAIKCFS